MARTNQRGSNNNNSEGRNQYSRGWSDTARERPAATAAVAAAAVGAGVFLWSRREQISNQLSQLSDQIGEWSQQMQSGRSETTGEGRQFETVGMSESDSPSAFGATPQAKL